MLAKLWRRLKATARGAEELRNEVAVERTLLEQEQHERDKREATPIPPGRTNTDWTYVPPP